MTWTTETETGFWLYGWEWSPRYWKIGFRRGVGCEGFFLGPFRVVVAW